MYSREIPDDGRKDRPKHVELFQSKINLRHWCIWLVLLQKLRGCRSIYVVMYVFKESVLRQELVIHGQGLILRTNHNQINK